MTHELLNILGETNFRGEKRRFGIKIDDRRRHVYIVGKTGVGKSTMIENMIINDIKAGQGLAFLDPHGDSAEEIIKHVPENRLDDVIYFDPSDTDFPIAFNPLEQVDEEFRHLVASSMMGVFEKIWADSWSARMKYILNNTLLALLENPGTTLLSIQRMLNNPEYRKEIVANLRDPVIKSFWVDEFANYSQRFESEATAAIQNKVGQFVSNPLIRNILGQKKSSINIRRAMDERKILIFNLSKGRIGEDNSALIGAMVITKIQLAAMSRVDTPQDQRRDFFLYVDEFQNFATGSFATILSEARKYRLSLIIAHQYLDQLDNNNSTTVRSAIFGNVGTMVAFRIGANDAEYIEKEFLPEFEGNDLVNLAKYHIYIKLMIDGIASRPFAALTLSPPPKPPLDLTLRIIQNTRDRYSLSRAKVNEIIAEDWIPSAQRGGANKSDKKEGGGRQDNRWQSEKNNVRSETRKTYEGSASKSKGSQPHYVKKDIQKIVHTTSDRVSEKKKDTPNEPKEIVEKNPAPLKKEELVKREVSHLQENKPKEHEKKEVIKPRPNLSDMAEKMSEEHKREATNLAPLSINDQKPSRINPHILRKGVEKEDDESNPHKESHHRKDVDMGLLKDALKEALDES